jgi:cytochrome c
MARSILILFSAHGALAHAQDMSQDKKDFAVCGACHSTGQTHGLGPGLLRIVGRKSATAQGFHYSNAMKRANLTWDEKTFDVFI